MIRNEQSYGIIPLFRSGGQCMHLLVRHKKGHWSFPKGHSKDGESSFDTAIRELHEETGIADCTILPGISFSDTYMFTDEAGDTVNKTVTYYLGVVHDPRVDVHDDGVDEAQWLDPTSAEGMASYDSDKRIIDNVQKYLHSQNLIRPPEMTQ